MAEHTISPSTIGESRGTRTPHGPSRLGSEAVTSDVRVVVRLRDDVGDVMSRVTLATLGHLGTAFSRETSGYDGSISGDLTGGDGRTEVRGATPRGVTVRERLTSGVSSARETVDDDGPPAVER